MTTTPNPKRYPNGPQRYPQEPGEIATYAAADPGEIATYAAAELVVEPAPAFLSLPTRRVLYVAGLAAVVISPILAVQFPEYAAAVLSAGAPLTAAALGTALANPSR